MFDRSSGTSSMRQSRAAVAKRQARIAKAEAADPDTHSLVAFTPGAPCHRP